MPTYKRSMLFQSPPSRGMGCEYRPDREELLEIRNGFNPLLRGAWAASGPPGDVPGTWAVRFNPLLRGAWAASLYLFLLFLLVGEFQSPPSRGMGCEQRRSGPPSWRTATSFNPLLRGAWAASGKTNSPASSEYLASFNPLLRGAWAASWVHVAPRDPGTPGVSIPSFAGHGLRVAPRGAGAHQERGEFQSPPSRGMGCESGSAAAITIPASFNPLLRGAWAARTRPSTTTSGPRSTFQSPPSRGMGCESCAFFFLVVVVVVCFNPLLRGAWAASVGPRWGRRGHTRTVSIPSFAEHGLRGTRKRLHVLGWTDMFQSPPSRGMGCENGSAYDLVSNSFWVSIPSFAGHGLRGRPSVRSLETGESRAKTPTSSKKH